MFEVAAGRVRNVTMRSEKEEYAESTEWRSARKESRLWISEEGGGERRILVSLALDSRSKGDGAWLVLLVLKYQGAWPKRFSSHGALSVVVVFQDDEAEVDDGEEEVEEEEDKEEKEEEEMEKEDEDEEEEYEEREEKDESNPHFSAPLTTIYTHVCSYLKMKALILKCFVI